MWKQREGLTRIALKTVELMPSATSYSPFSLGLVKLCSLPEPNILKHTNFDLFSKPTIIRNRKSKRDETRTRARASAAFRYLPNMVFGCAVKMDGSTTKRVLSTISVTLSEVLVLRLPTDALAPASLGFS